MGRVSQVLGYTFGFIIFVSGALLTLLTFFNFLFFLSPIPILGLLLIIFGFILMYLGHRSRPTKEKEMLKIQAEEYLREQKLKKEMEKREIEEMKRAEKERKKAEKKREKE